MIVGTSRGSNALWFTLDDTNFIGNSSNIDAISAVTENDYSVSIFNATNFQDLSTELPVVGGSNK